MELRGLGYIGLNATDTKAWSAFAEDLIGLMPSEPALAQAPGTESLYYRLDARSWRVAVHTAAEPGLAYVGWELPDRDALHAARAHLEACKVEVEADLDPGSRGVSELVAFADPWGHRHELFYGAPTDLEVPFASQLGISGFETRHGMGHALIVVPDAHEAEAWFARVLAFRTTDRMSMGGGKRTIFMRAQVRHHSLAVTDVLPEPGFHHLMLEAQRIEDVGRAWDRVQRAGTPIAMTLGQHANDLTVSFYVESPSGCGIELGFGAMEIDEQSWMVREVGNEELWGHEGVAMDEIQAGAAGPS